MGMNEKPLWVCFDLGGVLFEILHTMEERLELCDASG